ncbi:HAD-IIIC family phosphatase [Haliangium ochraceum]|uniref:FkbH-like protein n=1 Tax=Haliangium ochraceum (strain DSM 14365 / JCM 11303 / SMP-2) TaxID=502025 RepID=D0LS44_HALO1|nr:HAD-IIIC family phosphatase [Haliangium ochraceum]ACY13741.1 FkbH like protein [Haliangium ochraceum DSM 14365]AMM72009.1 FkbH-like protein [Haliangium ochraceum DSM 14365]
MSNDAEQRDQSEAPIRPRKCVVWDLDNTVWDGVLSEDAEVRLRPGIAEIMAELDRRGILQSVASKNNHEQAFAKLEDLGLADYFLYPQIHWGAKSGSIENIAKQLNIGLDALLFIDDQPFERDEIQHRFPDVLCIDAAALDGFLDRAEVNPRFITDESAQRRKMYLSDISRKRAEESYAGPEADFLASLDMHLTIAPADEQDLARAEELTVRTNQLNATGVTYSYEELDGFRQSADHLLLVASLEDKYGSYGKIGLALVDCAAEEWNLQLLLMSCRVMSRGVGTALIGDILRRAQAAGVRLRADFIDNDRNRMMYVTYKFAGFREISREGARAVLEHPLDEIFPLPPYMHLHSDRSSAIRTGIEARA